jgi:hypothetical protein
MTAPRRPTPEVVPGTDAHRLIRGVLRLEIPALYVREVVLHRASRWAVSVADTGDGDDVVLARDTTFHILWAQDEDESWIEVTGERFAVAPGDTMSVPADAGIRRAGRMLIVEIDGAGGNLGRVIAPSHGLEEFVGYNRRTDYDTPGSFSLARWKITQPLSLPASDDPFLIVGLATPLALIWNGGVDRIGRGECRVILPETGAVTLVPDGLGYALVVQEC